MPCFPTTVCLTFPHQTRSEEGVYIWGSWSEGWLGVRLSWMLPVSQGKGLSLCGSHSLPVVVWGREQWLCRRTEAWLVPQYSSCCLCWTLSALVHRGTNFKSVNGNSSAVLLQFSVSLVLLISVYFKSHVEFSKVINKINNYSLNHPFETSAVSWVTSIRWHVYSPVHYDMLLFPFFICICSVCVLRNGVRARTLLNAEHQASSYANTMYLLLIWPGVVWNTSSKTNTSSFLMRKCLLLKTEYFTEQFAWSQTLTGALLKIRVAFLLQRK